MTSTRLDAAFSDRRSTLYTHFAPGSLAPVDVLIKRRLCFAPL